MWGGSVAKDLSFASPESDFVGQGNTLFQQLDTDESGSLDRDEVSQAAALHGLSEADAMALFDQLDFDGDGVLTPHEWSSQVSWSWLR